MSFLAGPISGALVAGGVSTILSSLRDVRRPSSGPLLRDSIFRLLAKLLHI